VKLENNSVMSESMKEMSVNKMVRSENRMVMLGYKMETLVNRMGM
jgi:hypothetical protein